MFYYPRPASMILGEELKKKKKADKIKIQSLIK